MSFISEADTFLFSEEENYAKELFLEASVFEFGGLF